MGNWKERLERIEKEMEMAGIEPWIIGYIKSAKHALFPETYWIDEVKFHKDQFLAAKPKIKCAIIWRITDDFNTVTEGTVSLKLYKNSIGGEGYVLEVYTGKHGWLTVEENGITPNTSADATLIEEYRWEACEH